VDWDDLKVLLALSRKRSARGAAQLLGISNSTITRRLDDLERSLGTRLFDRTPEGYRMTQSAENLLPMAEQVEDMLLAMERQVRGVDQELQGRISLTLPPANGFNALMPRLAQFAADYPGIDLEIISSSDLLDLGRREADIAVRIFRRGFGPAENLIGRRVSPMTASAYVHRDLLNPDDPEDVSHLHWIGSLDDQPWRDLCRNGDLPVRHNIPSINLQQEAVQAKMGILFAACAMFRDRPDIVRVPGEQVHNVLDLWVLTHKDLQLTARMRMLREILAEELTALRPYFDSTATPADAGLDHS